VLKAIGARSRTLLAGDVDRMAVVVSPAEIEPSVDEIIMWCPAGRYCRLVCTSGVAGNTVPRGAPVRPF
jgi:hypothetical protein